jgi:hypothetical protein
VCVSKTEKWNALVQLAGAFRRAVTEPPPLLFLAIASEVVKSEEVPAYSARCIHAIG